MGGTTDEAAFAAHVDKLDKSLQVYDKILSKQKYVAGDVRVLPSFTVLFAD